MALSWNHGARSIIELEADGCFEFTVYPETQGIACGLNSANAGTDPREIQFGIMALDRQFCVVEHGVARTSWTGAGPIIEWVFQPTLVFRIYRVAGRVVYTVDAGSKVGGREEDGTNSWYASYAESNIALGIEVRGRVIYQSTGTSHGTVFLDSSFASAWETIADARLLDVVPASGWVNAAAPAWQAKGMQVAENSATSVTPAWVATASEWAGDRAIGRAAPWVAIAGDSVFETLRNEVRATSPAWRTEDPNLKVRPIRSPAWKAKGQGPNKTHAKSPPWFAHSGNAGNLAYAVQPAWTAASMAPRNMDGLAYGQVAINLAFANFVNDGSIMDTVPMVGILGGHIDSFSTSVLTTEPMVGYLGGSGQVFGVSTLATVPMVAVLGGNISHYAVITLGTVTMTGVLGGSIDAISEVTLPVEPMVGVLGGSIGLLSQLNEVFALCITGGKPGGTTQYQGYEFNSVAKIGGRYYGATTEGLFLLEGDDDAGEPIEARFGFGQLDFGSPQLKTIAYAYLGAAAGAMYLNIQAMVKGCQVAYTYPARGHGRSMQEIRFDLGRGLSSTYVIPTFSNCHGGHFEVDTVRFLTAESKRRIYG